MKLLYLANNRIPSEKANSLQIMQSCQAFQRQGADVTLVVPHRRQPEALREVRDPFEYYRLRSRFPIHRLPCIDLLETAPGPLQPAAFAVQAMTFAAAACTHLLTARADLYYTRDPLSAALVALMPARIRARTAYEAHTFPRPGPRRALHMWSAGRLGGLVCITRGLAEEYQACGIDPQTLLIAPDAVDLERFSNLPERAQARLDLGLPAEARIACYTGHLYEWKGARTLALASRFMPADHLVCIVGGTAEDTVSFRRFLEDERLERVHAVGYVTPDRVPAYLAAADAVALPNSARSETSARYTSPMKLFEYMAAGRPIVASRLPSLGEVLRDGENALLVEPDNAEALARGIRALLDDRTLAERLAEVARLEVQDYTWDARANVVLSFLRSRQGAADSRGPSGTEVEKC